MCSRSEALREAMRRKIADPDSAPTITSVPGMMIMKEEPKSKQEKPKKATAEVPKVRKGGKKKDSDEKKDKPLPRKRKRESQPKKELSGDKEAQESEKSKPQQKRQCIVTIHDTSEFNKPTVQIIPSKYKHKLEVREII